jgi:predicted HNH restriction endonuclease
MKWETDKHLYKDYKEFRKAYRKQYYQENKEDCNAKGLARLREIKSKLVEYKGNKCAHCNNSYPDVAYDFHHLDPSTKEVWTNLRNRSYKSALKEVDKCILLCSNCHRIEHARLDGRTTWRK